MLYRLFFSEQKEGKTYFSSDLFLLIMVKHISIFNIFISIFTLCTLLDELENVELMNGKIHYKSNYNKAKTLISLEQIKSYFFKRY